MSAQLLEGKNINFGIVARVKCPTTIASQGIKVGSVVVYTNGRKIPFTGYRSAEVLAGFLKKINGPLIKVIDDKPSHRDFNRVRTTKVVGYFQENSQAYQEFEAAALEHQPNIPFYAVFDPVVAGHVQISNVSGSVQIVREEDKVRVDLAQKPATAADIHRSLRTDGRDIFRHVVIDDIHSVMEAGSYKTKRLYVFSRKSSS